MDHEMRRDAANATDGPHRGWHCVVRTCRWQSPAYRQEIAAQLFAEAHPEVEPPAALTSVDLAVGAARVDYLLSTTSDTVHLPSCSVLQKVTSDLRVRPWTPGEAAGDVRACRRCLRHGLPTS